MAFLGQEIGWKKCCDSLGTLKWEGEMRRGICWGLEQRTVVLEKTLESPLDCKEIQPVHPEVDKSRVFIGRTDAEAETPILWPPHAKSWLIGKDPDAGRDWGQEEKVTTGWDGWMASPTRWAWVWVNSGSWWWTGRPGVLWFVESQSRTRLSDWTELSKEVSWLTRELPEEVNSLFLLMLCINVKPL